MYVHKEILNMKTDTIVAKVVLTMLLLALPASASDYTLGVYGNANEDDTINMQDVTYTELIILEYRDITELSDAKYDGKINMQDVTQIELVILGKEKELTVLDSDDRVVTVRKPVKRAVLLCTYVAEAVRVLEAQNEIAGVYSLINQDAVYFPELSKLPDVGFPADYEAILSLDPDMVIVFSKGAEHAKKLPGIAVVRLPVWKPDVFIEELVKLGYIFGRVDEAECYIYDFHDRYLDFIIEQTEGLSEDKLPNVYVGRSEDLYSSYGAKSGAQQMIDICGGKNILADLDAAGRVQIDPEDVVEKNPDVIIRYIKQTDAGYDYDEPSKIKILWEDTVNRPELAKVNAVTDGRVYVIDVGLNYGLDYPIAMAYWAKWIHPALFEDLDPSAIHQEFLTEFQGLDYDLNEHGVFVYHQEEHPDGK